MTAIRLPEAVAIEDIDAVSPLRVALFTDTFAPQINGVARTLARLVDALRERGAAVRVYTTSDPDALDLPHVKRVASMPFWAYPELRLAFPGAKALARDVAAWEANLIHAATPFGLGLAGRSIAHMLDIPLVTSYHTSLTAYAPLYGLGALSEPGWHYLRWFHNGGAMTFAPTAAIARDLRARGFHRLAVWGRGVESSTFNARWRSAALRRELGVGDDGQVIGYVGRLAKEKRVDVLLDAIELVASRLEHVTFALAGDGPQGTHYRSRATENARFVGRLEGRALSEFYASCDVLVFPSDTDTFGNVLLEAMASGLAIIAADTAVSREVLGGGREGLFYRADDPAALAARIEGLASATAARRELARVALGEAARRTWGHVFDSLFDSYLLVAQGTARRRVAGDDFVRGEPLGIGCD